MNLTNVHRFRLATGALAGLLAVATPAVAQEQNRYDREMTVSPAEADEVEGVFAFSQDALELRDENAATLYLQAFTYLPEEDEEHEAEYWDLLKTPLDQLDAEEAKAWTDRLSQFHTEPAVRRRYADWGAPIEEQGYQALLPYLNDTRQLADLLGLKARGHAAAGEFDEAADVLRRMFVLAQHIGNARDAVLVEGLVGVGNAAITTDNVARIMELPAVPNRYWALATLPTPMFEFTHWMQGERSAAMAVLLDLYPPELMTAPRWIRFLDSLETGQLEGEPLTPKEIGQSFLVALAAAEYLQSRGYTFDKLEREGLLPTLARIMADKYFSRFDQMAKFGHLPFPKGYSRFEALEQSFAQEDQAERFPGFGTLADILLPSLSRAYERPYQLQRQIDALRIVEAIRDHVAANGELPASLDDCRLPIPEDPMTGEAFGYEVDGRTFHLTARRYDADRADSGFTWRVTVRETDVE